MENIKHEFLQFVAEAIKDIYQYNIIEAQEIVTSSFLPELLKEIPYHVQHYDAEYWAKEIMEDLFDDNLRHLTNEENEIYQKGLEKKTTWSEKNIFDNGC